MGDLLFNFTEWLRTTFMVDFSLWISDTSFSQWLVTHFWAIPTVQVIHILAISSAFGSILMINLRIFGWAGMDRSFAEIEKRYTRWIWWSLVTLIFTGLCLITAEPIRELINPIFWIKMVLVVVAIFVSLWFHRGVMKRLSVDGTITAGIKGGAVFIIVLWCVIMLCGRWIAYAPV